MIFHSYAIEDPGTMTRFVKGLSLKHQRKLTGHAWPHNVYIVGNAYSLMAAEPYKEHKS